MADLIAQGEEAQQRWRRALPKHERVVLGRAAGVWAVPWDQHISRQHAEIVWTGEQLEVKQLPQARNPVFFRGVAIDSCPAASAARLENGDLQKADRDAAPPTQFTVRPGEYFVIGRTTFTLADQRVNVTGDAPQPVQQQTFSAQYLKQLRFRNPDYRIEVLSRLPEAISGATSPNELCVRLVTMLLAGLPRADTAAVVSVEPAASSSGSAPQVSVLHWDRRLLTGGDFQPSERLILESLRQRQSVLHIWNGGEASFQQFTARGNYDWAFCTPVLGDSCKGWALYLAGRLNVDLPAMPGSTDPSDLREDMKFTELVANALSSLRQMQLLNRQHATLSQFFSPVVLSTLGHEDPDIVLAPRETEVSVLFCDLRGFSRQTEQHADNLLELLRRVGGALGVMTSQILSQGGVVGDFQGDAAMGFWGWPLAQPDAVRRTCLAALAIRRQFASASRDPESPLAGFHAGIGIATGRAVAGKIGTPDHVKVTVFGPVVNLASRLEGMTKILRAPILLDETTARAVRNEVSRDVARVRRLAVVRPYGMETPLEVSELLPPVAEYPLLTEEHLELCERALDAFLSGRWSQAFELLHRVPPQDKVADFLTVYIAQHDRTPPPNWDGVIALSSK